MKRLVTNGKQTDFFFSDKSSFDDIFEWVSEQVMFGKDNIFNLNEQHSCSLSNGLEGSMNISGDEDLVQIKIEEVKPIL